MLVLIQLGTNMAAGNKERHLSLSCYKSANESPEEFKKKISVEYT